MQFDLKGYIKGLMERRRGYFSVSIFLMFVILLFWFLGQVASPFLAPAGTIDFGETGAVGIRDNNDEIMQIDNGFARFFYVAGDVNCHQHASRSYFLNDNQMPFCARCTAIFLGMAVGIFITLILVLEINILWIILGLVPIGLDGGIQLVTDYESSNPLRFVTGLLAGMVVGVALGIITGEVGDVWKHRKMLRKERQ